MPGRRVTSIAEDPDLEVFQDFDVQDPEEAPLKRRPWAADEDEHLKMLVDEHAKSWRHRNVPAHAERQAAPRAVAEPPAAAAAQGEWSVDEDRRLDARAGGTKGADLRALHAQPDGQRHQEPVELDHPQVARAGGREWTAEETDLRNQFFGKGGHPPRSEMAARTKAARAEGEEGEGRPRAGSARRRRRRRTRRPPRTASSSAPASPPRCPLPTPARPAPDPASLLPPLTPPRPPRRRSSRN